MLKEPFLAAGSGRHEISLGPPVAPASRKHRSPRPRGYRHAASEHTNPAGQGREENALQAKKPKTIEVEPSRRFSKWRFPNLSVPLPEYPCFSRARARARQAYAYARTGTTTISWRSNQRESQHHVVSKVETSALADLRRGQRCIEPFVTLSESSLRGLVEAARYRVNECESNGPLRLSPNHDVRSRSF